MRNSAPTNTLPHLASQPGLRGHSYSDEDALIHKYLVSERTPSGWLGLKSRREYVDALDVFADLVTGNPSKTYRIVDQSGYGHVVLRSTEDDAR
jgi:hypothetical protein